MEHALDRVPGAAAAHHRADDVVGGAFVLELGGGLFQVQRHRGCEHLDMADLLGRGVEEHVAILAVGCAAAPSLEEILHADADFALDAADRLLEHAGEDRVGIAHANGILQALVMIVHDYPP